MYIFLYKAYDVNGKFHKGKISADNEEDIRSYLRRINLSAVSVQKSYLSYLNINYIKQKDIVIFSRQISTLLNANIPLEEALNSTANQTDNKSLGLLIYKIREDILQGLRLNQALKKYPKYFNSNFSSLVSAGDSTGNLGFIFNSLSSYLEEIHKAKKAIVSAMAYPMVIFLFSLLAIIVLLIFVMPQIVSQFVKSGSDLPLLTSFLLSVSENFHFIILIFLILFTLTYLYYKSFIKNKDNLIFLEKKILSLPAYGSFLLNSDLERFSSTISLMLSSGLNFDQALDESIHVVNNEYLKSILNEANKNVKEGGDFVQSIEKYKVFPHIFIQLISSGFASGNLKYMFDKISEYLKDEIINKRSMLVSLAEPLIIIFMGAIVLMIILAILIPIIQMNTLTLG